MNTFDSTGLLVPMAIYDPKKDKTSAMKAAARRSARRAVRR
jgi:hypothetical protein